MLIVEETSEGPSTANRRRTHNTMTKGRETKRHTIVYKKTIHEQMCLFFRELF
jgi:hypothetical protein